MDVIVGSDGETYWDLFNGLKKISNRFTLIIVEECSNSTPKSPFLYSQIFPVKTNVLVVLFNSFSYFHFSDQFLTGHQIIRTYNSV